MSGFDRSAPKRRIPTSRGLVAASKNPTCELLAAMGLEGVDERDLRESLTGVKFEGEYGERQSAKRRGFQFEERLRANDAAILKQKIGPLIGVAPEDVVVRDFGTEHPGPVNVLNAVRLHRIREIFKSILKGDLSSAPDVIIQPTLALDVIGGAQGSFYISPDVLVFDRRNRTFSVGELKSFIVRRKNVQPKDLENTRRQTAAGVLALSDELAKAGLPPQELTRSFFVFAKPNGLQAHEPFEELLSAEIVEVDRARKAMRQAALHLAALRSKVESRNLADLAMDLKINLRESCTSTCLVAPYCAKREPNNPAVFGDVGLRALGSVQLDAIPSILNDAPNTLTPAQRNLRSQFERAAIVAGIPFADLRKVIA